MKNISFLSENFQFLEVKFSIYFNRQVFVMNLRIWLSQNLGALQYVHVYILFTPTEN